MARRVGLPAAAGTLVLVLALQGCLGPPTLDSGPAGPAADSPSEGGQGGQGGGLSGAGFAWLPFGPANPSGPGAWYRSLEDGRCGDATKQAGDSLAQALAAVCRAAIEKKRSEWAVAQKSAARPRNGTAAPDCLDTAAEALLGRALAWHAQHPDADPVVKLPTADSRVACEFKIAKVTPAQGPLAGGTAIEISGGGINDVEAVIIGGKAVKVDSSKSEEQGGKTVETLKVTTPPADRPATVDVAVRNRAGVATALCAYTYLPGAAATPSTTDSPAPMVTPSTVMQCASNSPAPTSAPVPPAPSVAPAPQQSPAPPAPPAPPVPQDSPAPPPAPPAVPEPPAPPNQGAPPESPAPPAVPGSPPAPAPEPPNQGAPPAPPPALPEPPGPPVPPEQPGPPSPGGGPRGPAVP